MRALYDKTALDCSRLITSNYSTSFSLASRLLGRDIRHGIYAVYGFVRIADEIVDTFHETDQRGLLDLFEKDLDAALRDGISLNPVLHAFAATVKKYNIDDDLIRSFLKSMRWDLSKSDYDTRQDYEQYIYGSADVVGLMCLKIFVEGDEQRYMELKESASRLGSAFQKVNFLRDLKHDLENLERSYFPELKEKALTPEAHREIIADIRNDFEVAYEGIRQLPRSSRLGVYTAYRYYTFLLKKLSKVDHYQILKKRMRVSNGYKMVILIDSYVRVRLNIL